jgi:hypothetical protein
MMLGGAMILVSVALAAVRRHIPPLAKPRAVAVVIPASDP